MEERCERSIFTTYIVLLILVNNTLPKLIAERKTKKDKKVRERARESKIETERKRERHRTREREKDKDREKEGDKKANIRFV